MENSNEILAEDKINEICDNIQFYCADEEVKKAHGDIEDEGKRAFLVRLYEFIHSMEERDEEMGKELRYREYLLSVLENTEVTDADLERQHKNEIKRTKEIIKGMKATIELDKLKISLFNKGFPQLVLDNYEILKSIDLITGNQLGMIEYQNLQREIFKEDE